MQGGDDDDRMMEKKAEDPCRISWFGGDGAPRWRCTGRDEEHNQG